MPDVKPLLSSFGCKQGLHYKSFTMVSCLTGCLHSHHTGQRVVCRPPQRNVDRQVVLRCSPRTETASAQAGRAQQPNDLEPLFLPNEPTPAACNILDNGGALDEGDYGKFVQFFRQASPYIAGHRARTFVVVIPGDVVMQQDLLQALVSDIALLHGLGIRLVIVLGAAPIIDAALEQQGGSSVFVGGYRITDANALEAAVEAAGRSRTAVEQFLSRGPSVPVFRRHAKGEGEMHFGPALNVVGGNYVAAKRRGILNGVDFGYTGEVSKWPGATVIVPVLQYTEGHRLPHLTVKQHCSSSGRLWTVASR
eukprot:GHUV01018052.1.p1 GENE.GHUV01018052.1~~GHUV01018052.1.p1  ORF type:complete len:308 (+),score=52.39 GHUV01018052.1:133-1056(+)